MAPRETENTAYAKFWCDKESALWYVMVFSGVVNQLAYQFAQQVRIQTAHVIKEIAGHFFLTNGRVASNNSAL